MASSALRADTSRPPCILQEPKLGLLEEQDGCLEVKLGLVIATPEADGRLTVLVKDQEVAGVRFEDTEHQRVRHLFELAALDFELPDGVVLAKLVFGGLHCRSLHSPKWHVGQL